MLQLGQLHGLPFTVYLQHSENRYGKGQREDEGSAGSEEEDFFKKVRAPIIADEALVCMLLSRRMSSSYCIQGCGSTCQRGVVLWSM